MKRRIKYLLFIAVLPVWLGWDISQSIQDNYGYRSFLPSSESRADLAPAVYVAIVRSDDPALADPSAGTSDPSSQTIEQMVSRAIDLAGGFPAIKSGMKVLIKPNLVEVNQPSGSGTDTDVRVVEAVVKYVDAIDHGNIKIMVGDGSPRPFTTFEKSVAAGRSPWIQLYGNADATKDAGYQKLLTRMLAAGVDFRLTNLNGNSDTAPWNELREVTLPGGGQAQAQKGNYHIHQDVLDADVYITVPVMKIHDPGITCALKNQIGLAPSSLYGFSKTAGVTATGTLQSSPGQHKLLHTSQTPYNWTDKEIVDLCTIAKIKYVVVDALMCLEVQKTTLSNKSNQVRMNMILAGADPVAVDHVCARLMGLNPDDVEHITLAERVGLGTNDPDKITIVGADLSTSTRRFRKDTTIPDQMFGQSNRNWIVSKSFSLIDVNDPINYEFLPNEAQLSPLPGDTGWSRGVYFINDRINLGDYYAGNAMSRDNVVGYAFTYFNAPQDQEAELWTGSDEPLKIWLNGNLIYNFNSFRLFPNTMATAGQTTKIQIRKGLNRLLVKAVQDVNASYFDFSLNICNVEPNASFRGSRVWGLKFMTDPGVTFVENRMASAAPGDYSLANGYPNPFNHNVQIGLTAPANENVQVTIFNHLGQKVKTVYSGTMRSGTKQVYWDGVNEAGITVASGSYLVVLTSAGHKVASTRIQFIK
jgi:uncharacterized protein (DUF362 family)